MSPGVRFGNVIAVSGQVSVDETGALVGIDDVAAQARQCFANIERILGRAGASLSDVVQLTGYLVDPAHAGAYLEVRRATFAVDPPATTTVVVAALLGPQFLVEVQVLAVVPTTADASPDA
ncbi:MAG: RidA family protein [Ilumatobacteraceae bacterium]